MNNGNGSQAIIQWKPADLSPDFAGLRDRYGLPNPNAPYREPVTLDVAAQIIRTIGEDEDALQRLKGECVILYALDNGYTNKGGLVQAAKELQEATGVNYMTLVGYAYTVASVPEGAWLPDRGSTWHREITAGAKDEAEVRARLVAFDDVPVNTVRVVKSLMRDGLVKPDVVYGRQDDQPFPVGLHYSSMTGILSVRVGGNKKAIATFKKPNGDTDLEAGIRMVLQGERPYIDD